MMQAERLQDCLQEILTLAALNGQEVYGESYEPSLPNFLDLDRFGLIKLYTYRAEDKIVGYAIFIVSRKTHQRSILCADCTSIFIHKKYRGLKAVQLIKFAENKLKEIGIQHIQYHAAGKFMALFNRLGYATADYTFVKEV